MLLQRSERNLVILLALITMSGPMSLTILFPALPALELDFAISRKIAQVTTSLATLILAPGVLIYGPLADRFGRRPPLLGALLLLGFGSVICIFSPRSVHRGSRGAGRREQAGGMEGLESWGRGG